jgi:putative membrane protein
MSQPQLPHRRLRGVRRATVLVALLAAGAPWSLASAQGAAKAKGALDDPTIVAIFDAANTWDIATGELAVKAGSTKEVREFGAMLARDHTNVRGQGRDLAAKLHVTPTPPKDFAMAKDHAAAMTKLKGLKGAAFNRAFYEHEVAYHKAVIDALTTTLLPALQNAEVRALVTKVAPAFQAHMMAAQAALDKLPR